jgi:alkylation response protein AidB-like acyl-CoA dehydrogenase
MGVVGLTVPEASGGLGLGLVDLVLLLEEAGRSGLPEPLLATTGLGVPLLAGMAEAAGTGASADGSDDGVVSRVGALLAEVAAGETVLAVGLDGMAAVPDAVGADVLLLEHAGALYVVDRPGVVLTPRPSIDGLRGLAAVEWTPDTHSVLVSGNAARVAVRGVRDRAAMGTGALLVGVADTLVTMAAGYAVERHQFGKPIGSFQAVKHLLATALQRVEFARPLVYRAAWSLDEADPEADVHASMAKSAASDAATLAARTALQVHGAIGYTWEHDVQLWMKRAWSLAAAWGDAAEHRARVLDRLVRPADGPG